MDIIQLLSAYLQFLTVTYDRQRWFYPVMDWIVTNLADPLETFGATWEHFPDARSLVIKVPAANGDLRRPVLFLHHADVVPGTDFSGLVADDCLWGRGALDMKCALVMQLWALRQFLQSGGRLKRNLVFLINTDEEEGGASCQVMVENHWDELGNPEAVIDEGGFIFEDFLGVCSAPIMVAEKAPGTLRVSAEDPLEFLRALYRLSKWNTPHHLHPAVVENLKRVFRAKNKAWMIYLVLSLAKVPFLGPWVLAKVFNTAVANATVRNILCLTQLGQNDGVGNVAGPLDLIFRDRVPPGICRHKLPSGGRHASMPDPRDRAVAKFLKQGLAFLETGFKLDDPLLAGFNIRLLPGQDPAQFLAQARAVAGSEVTLELEMWPGTGGQSSWDTEVFRILERALQAHGPSGMVTAPFLTPATTDSRWFESRGIPAYRIIPVMIGQELLATIHGTGERIPLVEMERGVKVYAEIFRRL